MPVIKVYSPLEAPPEGLLASICREVLDILKLPDGHCWAIWQEVAPHSFHKPRWSYGSARSAPVVEVLCKSTYRREQVSHVIRRIRDILALHLSCDPDDVYVAAQRVQPGETLVRGDIWVMEANESSEVCASPIGWVRSSRTEPIDDFWGELEATIELDSARFGPDALLGLNDFSHVEVVFLMHRVPPDKVETGARHPREREDWPRVGIFAQRGKSRPNRLGVSRCVVVAVDGVRLKVRGLDAIDGSPVLDIKPYMAEFGPIGRVRQPAWSSEVMRDYYKPASSRD